MSFDRQLENAAEHIQKAQGCLERTEEKHPSFVSSVQDHLEAAITEITNARESSRPHVSQVGRRGISELASGVMGLLSFLLDQMNDTSRRLEPLRPSREPAPLQRLSEADLKQVENDLGDLRRLTGRLEAELRLLKAKMDENGGRAN